MKIHTMHVMVIFGTRPEAIKLAPVIVTLNRSSGKIKTTVLSTGQHRTMLDDILNEFSIVPDYDLNIMRQNQTLAEIVARGLGPIWRILRDEHPDIVITQGDTSTALAASLAAFYSRIPVGHVEAGLRTQKRYTPFPEEMNRRLISVLSNFHFAPTKSARDNLLKEGIDKKSILITGNTIVDALISISAKKEHHQNSRFKGIDFKRERIVIVTAHRRENAGRPILEICKAVNKIVGLDSNIRVIFSVHRNPKVRKTIMQVLSDRQKVLLVDPIPYSEFVCLMKKAFLIISDSGGIQEEASVIGCPMLILREATERPEVIDKGGAVLVGTDAGKITREVKRLMEDCVKYRRMSKPHRLFGDGKASIRIVKFLLDMQSKII